MFGCYNSWYLVSSDTNEPPINYFLSVSLLPKLAETGPLAPLKGLYEVTVLLSF